MKSATRAKDLSVALAEKIRSDFPILNRRFGEYPLAYLDNAATAQKPRAVIDRLTNYYSHQNANVHRGIHRLSEEATAAYEAARRTVATFVGAPDEREIIFTRNATEGLNLLAQGLKSLIEPGDEILISAMEHHSNIVPWQRLAAERQAKLVWTELTSEYRLDLDDLERKLSKRTKIVSLTHASNVLGTINPIAECRKLIADRSPQAVVAVDGAQSVPHLPVNVQRLGADTLVFSGHKLGGPTGIGVVWAKTSLLEKLQPLQFGGDMILEVTREAATWNDIPWKFEAGTPHIAGAIGLSAAIDYLDGIGLEQIENYLQGLTRYGLKSLSAVEGLVLYGPKTAEDRLPIFSFSFEGIHPHDVAQLLDEEGVAVRSGHLCAQPLMSTIGQPALTRASGYLYNTTEEIDRLVEGLDKVQKVFNNRGISPQKNAERNILRHSAK